MTNRKMFFTMLWGAVFRRRSRAMMAVIASLVGAATLFCLASVCVANRKASILQPYAT